VGMGYSGRGDWLSGPCLYPARHQHGDVHPSFGFNIRSGYGNCYVCGSILLKDICTELGIRPADYGGLCALCALPDGDMKRGSGMTSPVSSLGDPITSLDATLTQPHV
jgi:hypothetical protein